MSQTAGNMIPAVGRRASGAEVFAEGGVAEVLFSSTAGLFAPMGDLAPCVGPSTDGETTEFSEGSEP